MSESGSDDGPGRREVAHRLFAAEFEDADLSYSESDEERAPNYVVTPAGARVNRLFVVGVLTEVEQVSEDVLRGRFVDPTGAFVLYAGQYQPDEQAFLDRADPPAFVAVTGKARTFQPEDGDAVYTSVRPESISEVDAETRDRWTVDAAERTLDRVKQAAAAARTDARGDDLAARLRDDGVDAGLAEGIALALDHYGTTGTYLAALRDLALDAARVVAGEREEVDPLDVDPGDGDDDALAELAGSLPTPSGGAASPSPETPTEGDAPAAPADTDAAESSTATAPGGEVDAAESETDAGGAAESEPATGTEPAAEAGGDSTGETGSVASTTPEAADRDREDGGADVGAESTDTVGDFDGGDSGDFGGEEGGADPGDAGDVGDFEPDEEFELDEEEREEIEEEYGTDFQSGTEVDEPGEADIETPDPEDLEEAGGPDAAESGPAAGTEPGAVTEGTEPQSGPEPGAESEPEPAGGSEPEETEAVDDLEDAVVDLMTELDDGDGVDRSTLVDAARERYGVEASEVEDAIQDALMGGRCYEPDDATLKPI